MAREAPRPTRRGAGKLRQSSPAGCLHAAVAFPRGCQAPAGQSPGNRDTAVGRDVTREPATTAIPPARAAVYLEKAEDFLRAATRALEDGAEDSAALLSIHAAISACDSLTVRHLGLRSTSPRHMDVLALIDQLPTSRKDELKKHMRDLVSKKNVVEYKDRLLPRGSAAPKIGRAHV